MAVIELGDAAPTDARVPARTAVPQRWLRVAGVLAGVLATVAAGDPGPRPIQEATVPARLGAVVFAQDERLFVAEPMDAGQSGQRLSAYRLPGGQALWRVPLTVREPVGRLALVGDTLVLSTAWHGGDVEPRADQLLAVDAPTGALRWNRPAVLETTSGEGDLILWTGGPDPVPPDARLSGVDLRPGQLQAVDPQSGHVRWSVPMPGGTHRFYPAGSDPAAPAGSDSPAGRDSTVLLALQSGRVELRDLTTGAVRRAARFPAPGPATAPRWAGEVLGDLFVVRDRRSITGYGLDRLERRWSIAADPHLEYGPLACGAGLCSFGPGGGVRVWDPDTGRTRWEAAGWIDLWRAGADLVGTKWEGPDRNTPLTVLDPDSGRTLGELGDWTVLDPLPRGSRLTGLRIGADGQAWVADLDVPTRTVQIQHVLHDVADSCGVAGQALHCRRRDGSIGIWRLSE